MSRDETRATRRNAMLAFISGASVATAAVLASLATMPAIKGWYATLAKPFFTPPNWVFGPAWTILYILMAYAFWRVLVAPADSAARRGAITAFSTQLVLNALWSFVFFAWKMPGPALVVVLLMWLAIAVTIARFRPIDRTAALCLAPYLAWVTFATALNAGVWLLNS